MNVVMLSPGYPAEMAYFTRALAAVGARVIGVGDQPPHALPDGRPRRRSPTTSTCRSPTRAPCSPRCAGWPGTRAIDQVECLWEPYMILAAGIREDVRPARA